MPKRTRGGTNKDVNPQWWNMGQFTENTGSADTTLVTGVNTPIPRIPTGTRSTVMEILKVEFVFTNPQVAAAANKYYAALKTSNAINTGLVTFMADPSILAAAVFEAYVATAADVSYVPTQMVIDVTDGAGHGVLAAGDSIFVAVGTDLTANHTGTVNVRVLYRFKEVGVLEYVGIAQAQLS